MKHLARAIVLALSLSIVAACGGDDESPTLPASGSIEVKDNVFEPKSTSVGVGDAVTWTFAGKSAHNVTFDDFASKLMKDGTYEHTFDAAGSFDYHCTVHPGMNGTVVVK